MEDKINFIINKISLFLLFNYLFWTRGGLRGFYFGKNIFGISFKHIYSYEKIIILEFILIYIGN